MSPRSALALASLGFAVAWIALMWAWNAPLSTAAAVILGIAGAIAGLLWYLMMGWWLRHSVRRTNVG
jgi:hypothetical protein